jgi:hypothetical protein
MDQDPSHNRDLTHRIIGLTMRGYRGLSPGLLGSVYERCLCHELGKEGMSAHDTLAAWRRSSIFAAAGQRGCGVCGPWGYSATWVRGAAKQASKQARKKEESNPI